MRRCWRLRRRAHKHTAMSRPEPQPASCFNNSVSSAGRKEQASISQVMTLKASSTQRIIHLMQTMAHQSYLRACQLLCLPVDCPWCAKVTCCSAPTHQPKEDRNTQGSPLSPPSTILIVNISNSTLIDCVIGNDTYPAAVAERQPLMQESKLRMHVDTAGCNCSCGQQGAAQTTPPPPPPSPPPLPSAEHLNISIHSSHLNCVIIGDNNYMHAEQSQPFDETEEPHSHTH